MGLFSGLELGKRALQANQMWIRTIGHNIANANTAGYSRQRVTMVTTLPEKHIIGSLGTGVIAEGVYQVKDSFLTEQYRMQNKSLGEWTSKEKTLTQLENIFNEPGDSSVNNLLDQFWSKWSELSNNPDSSAYRADLISTTTLLTDNLHLIAEKLTDVRQSIDSEIELLIDKVNLIGSEIAQLNNNISRQEVGGDIANDLRDRRDSLIDELSTYIDVNVNEKSSGSVTVYIGSLAIVEGGDSFEIGTRTIGSGDIAIQDIVWAKTDHAIRSSGGQLKALLETRDEIIPEYENSLNAIIETMVTGVNEIHRNGYGLDSSTNVNFFDPDGLTAKTIEINIDILNNQDMIAASQSGEPGDNTNALAISDLRDSLLMNNGTATISNFYQDIIGSIGVKTNQAISQKENFELLVAQVENSRQSVQGVSLDEEMTMMIKYQNAYDAAARVITAIDEALGTVISMGITGRS